MVLIENIRIRLLKVRPVRIDLERGRQIGEEVPLRSRFEECVGTLILVSHPQELSGRRPVRPEK